MSATFPCPSCGIIYPWKPEFVGRQVGCKKCGVTMTVPDMATLPAAPVSLFDELGSVAEVHRPRPEAAPPAGPRIASGRTMTMRNGAYASNAGLIRVQWGKYLECFWQEPVITFICTCLVIVGVIVFDQIKNKAIPIPIAIGGGLLVGMCVVLFRLYQRREHLWHGCLCPAVVVSERPFLVAVATDLTTGHGSYPAIKVIRQPLGQMTGGPPAVGTRLATVACYYAGDDPNRWRDFEPIVINCVTADEQAIREAQQSIGQDEWAMLMHGVFKLGGKPRAGKFLLLR